MSAAVHFWALQVSTVEVTKVEIPGFAWGVLSCLEARGTSYILCWSFSFWRQSLHKRSWRGRLLSSPWWKWDGCVASGLSDLLSPESSDMLLERGSTTAPTASSWAFRALSWRRLSCSSCRSSTAIDCAVSCSRFVVIPPAFLTIIRADNNETGINLVLSLLNSLYLISNQWNSMVWRRDSALKIANQLFILFPTSCTALL